MEDKNVKKPHRISLENRKSCGLTGVVKVDSFDLNCVILQTEWGILTIKGEDLHVNKLSVEKGEVEVNGNISSLNYADKKTAKERGEGFLARVLG